jgi:ribosome-binding ATPase YchF (GTP1/OBG family)
VNPARDAQAMEDELILADLGVAERRLERIEKDLKKGKSAELEKERDLVQRCKRALEAGTPLRALQLAGDDLKRTSRVPAALRKAAAARHQPRRSGRRGRGRRHRTRRGENGTD